MGHNPGLCLPHLAEVTKGDNITFKSGPGSLTEQLVHPPPALLPPSPQPDLPPTLATPPDILNYAMSTVSESEYKKSSMKQENTNHNFSLALNQFKKKYDVHKHATDSSNRSLLRTISQCTK